MKISVVLLIVMSVFFINVRQKSKLINLRMTLIPCYNLVKLSYQRFKSMIIHVNFTFILEKGIIPFDKYHLFLHEIFIQGHQLNKNTQ